MVRICSQLRWILLTASTVSISSFSPSIRTHAGANSRLFRAPTRLNVAAAPISSSSSSTLLKPILSKIPPALVNAFQYLPWNIEKEDRRLQLRHTIEMSKMYRELGISEMSSSVDVTAAADKLMETRPYDISFRVRVEKARDYIIKLKASNSLINFEASPTSEADLIDLKAWQEKARDAKTPKVENPWKLPFWAQGIIVPPDRERVIKQGKLYGAFALVPFILPSMAGLLSTFTWVITIQTLNMRGAPQEDKSNFGFMRDRDTYPHHKISFFMCMSCWLLSKCFTVPLARFLGVAGTINSGPIENMFQQGVFFLLACYIKLWKKEYLAQKKTGMTLPGLGKKGPNKWDEDSKDDKKKKKKKD